MSRADMAVVGLSDTLVRQTCREYGGGGVRGVFPAIGERGGGRGGERGGGRSW